tara:strand:- start:138 stop:359 length:222 start_codon:yes stop_codon:yes gene_type:complete
MDISLSDTQTGTVIEPKSIHGILWLQTHFESTHWDSIIKGLALIPKEEAENLLSDAILAGLNVNFINSLTPID